MELKTPGIQTDYLYEIERLWPFFSEKLLIAKKKKNSPTTIVLCIQDSRDVPFEKTFSVPLNRAAPAVKGGGGKPKEKYRVR